jgi:hypothetical protein
LIPKLFPVGGNLSICGRKVNPADGTVVRVFNGNVARMDPGLDPGKIRERNFPAFRSCSMRATSDQLTISNSPRSQRSATRINLSAGPPFISLSVPQTEGSGAPTGAKQNHSAL